MKKELLFIGIIFFCIAFSVRSEAITIKILQTSDIHGNFFPYDFIENHPAKGSLSRVYTYVKQEREKWNRNLLLFDNGDILQGQPTAYYYNFIDTTSIHLAARLMNFMNYKAATMGNHDIETGPAVYDRFVRSCNFPWLAANAIRENSDKSYFSPYYIYEVSGIKIAVLGMITPAIPAWLPKNLWKDMYYKDIQSTAKQWIPYLKEQEKADVIVGLLHLSTESRMVATGVDEGGGEDLAYSVPGFDVVLLGHDHRPLYKKIANVAGDSVVIINPGAGGNFLSEVEVTIDKGSKRCEGKLIDVNAFEPDPDFLETFRKDSVEVSKFVSEKIAVTTDAFSSRDAYFGPSAFVDLIHRIQLDLTKADVSFAAPLSFDTQINKGDILVSDMFKLYKYENFLYTMTLTGREIQDFLEFSYGIWINQMQSPEDHLLQIVKNQSSNKYRFVNASYNFDSAAGISYTVDVTKPAGQRVIIDKKMRNGKTFDLNTKYTVAINSYRGNGGGGHLTEGAGIAPDQLTSRIKTATPVDLRYYMMQWMKAEKALKPEIVSHWKLVPEAWTESAGKKDYDLLF
ncbi:2',3'-cyclic-nucleotide 2'-phosphodiesterase [Bacteroidia bacterium]|nr:2',3'-cyclic-nucleotide 2'-phosphodiesterase [Bacteroidia bacterium]